MKNKKACLQIRDIASEGLADFDPLDDDGLGVGDCLFVGDSVGHAAGEFRDFDEGDLIFLSPVDDGNKARGKSHRI